MMASPMRSTTTPKSTRADVVDRYRRMRKLRAASSTPKAAAQSSSVVVSDENHRPTTPSFTTTPRSTTGKNPLSPKNDGSMTSNGGNNKKSVAVKPTPLPSRIRHNTSSHNAPSPLAAAPSPSVTASARRERRARHAKLLGSRGGRLTPRSSPAAAAVATDTSPVSTTTPAASTSSRPSLSRAQSASSVLPKYYSYEPPSSNRKTTTTKPPTTPSTALKIASSSGSVSSMDAKEVSRRVRERRARGAKKLFIMATSPSMDDNSNDDGHHHHGNLTPLERHLSSHEDATVDDDCPSVASDISTITMSTLSSLARDKRRFSRERKFSSSKLYARATTTSTMTTSSSTTEEKTTTTTPRGSSPVGRYRRGRSPVRSSPAENKRGTVRGTPVRSNATGVRRQVQSAGSHSTTSASDSGTSLSRRATTLQKAKRLARSRSRTRSSSTTTTNQAPVERRRFESPARRRHQSPARSVSSSRTPMSAESTGSSGSTTTSSRAGSRAASIQKARKTLARTKSQQKMKVESAAPTTTPSQKSNPVFAAREKVEARARSLSLAPQTRRNLDKRTARLKYHNEFASEVIKCQQEIGNPPPKHLEGENLHRRGEHGVSIFIRKRPIFDYEIHGGDFDVVFTEGRDGHDAVVLHSCNMHADMRKMLVKPTAFPCSAAFDETCTNHMLYTHVGKPLVRLAANGGLATIITYGQTGSGKTHTITGMEELVCKDLFRMVTKFVQVKIQFVELAGKQCKDLLGDGAVKLVDQEDGSVLLLNAVSENARSPEELYNSILRAKRKRATESTDKNDTSSRSHAVCRIIITSTKNEEQRGALTLIDCAGSERRNDSLYHSQDRQKESTEINSSLWALKECIRARTSGGSKKGPIPYRSSNLTRLLRESLEREDAQLCVIATIAPNATDSEHSIETLKTVTQLAAKDVAMKEMKTREFTATEKNSRPLSPKQWDRPQLVQWLGNKRFLETDVPEHIGGKQVMRMNRTQLNNAFFGGNNGEKADRLYNSLRAESERASRAQHQQRMAISREKYEL